MSFSYTMHLPCIPFVRRGVPGTFAPLLSRLSFRCCFYSCGQQTHLLRLRILDSQILRPVRKNPGTRKYRYNYIRKKKTSQANLRFFAADKIDGKIPEKSLFCPIQDLVKKFPSQTQHMVYEHLWIFAIHKKMLYITISTFCG